MSSNLEAVLGGQHAADVYLWPSADDVDDVRRSAEQAGWAFAHLDGTEVTDKAAFLDGIATALDFPSHFGRNFDALADSLRDVSERTLLLWDAWGGLARDDAKAFGVVVDVLRQRAGDEPAFVALLRGDGPGTDLALLL